MPFTHRVRRPWTGTTAGQLVDATGYRNLMQLEKLLYIVPLNESEAATANTPTEAQAMPPTDGPLKEHVVPVPDEPRVDSPVKRRDEPIGIPVPPPDADREPPAGQEPAIVPNDGPNRDDEEEARRTPSGPPPTPSRAPARRRLPE